MNPDSAHYNVADGRVAELLSPHSLAEFAASSGYGIAIRRNSCEYDPPAVGRRAQTTARCRPFTKAGWTVPVPRRIAGSKAPCAGYRQPGCDTQRPSPGVENLGAAR
jgi:hypothetical protein